MTSKVIEKDIVEEITLDAPAELQEKVISIDRISRTVKGGRRIRFRALMVLGDGKSRVGLGTAKANDVQTAIAKAKAKAKKSMIDVRVVDGTIPHETSQFFGSCKVILKPAPEGHSVIAGGAVRAVVTLCGIRNIVSKSIGSSNAVNIAMATYLALKNLDEVGAKR